VFAAVVVALLWAQGVPGATGRLVKHSEIANGRPEDILEGFISAYEVEQRFVVEIGDVLTLATPLGSSSSSTVVRSSGGRGAHGTTVDAGYYTTIYNGTQSATMGKEILAGLSGTPDPAVYMAPRTLSGTEVRVTHMKLAGTKKRPIVWAECEFVNRAEKQNNSGFITIGNLDLAFRLGEATSPKYITRDFAVQKVKEAKDLLDIGVYTQEQFDAEKAKYLPYIVAE
jgi:hypothetical protein